MLVVLENLKGLLLIGLYFLFMTWGLARLSRRDEKRKQERIAQRKESNEPRKEFYLDKGGIEIWWGLFIFIIGFIPLFFVMALLVGANELLKDSLFTVILVDSLARLIVLIPFALIPLVVLKKTIPCSDIAIDDDGLWYKHETKEKGLVPWDEIANIKRHSWLLCTDVFNSNDQRIMRVYHGLTDFYDLQEMLLEKARKNKEGDFPESFSKGHFHHFIHASAIFFLLTVAAIFGVVGLNDAGAILPAIAVLLCCFVFVVKYLLYAYRVEIDGKYIFVQFPLRRKLLGVSEIDTIEIDLANQVTVLTKRQKKYRLNMDVDGYMLYMALNQAKEDFLDCSNKPI